jgi:hypothetical protein
MALSVSVSAMNDPASFYRDGYWPAVAAENDAADDALTAIRAEAAAGRITTTEAASERCVLLTEHLARLARLRAQYLGGAS